GIIDLEEGKEYAVRIQVLDFAGNQKEARFKLIGKTPPAEKLISEEATVFYWNKENYFQQDEVEIFIPKGVLYEDLEFKFRKTNNGKYEIHDFNVPVHQFYTLSIEPENIPVSQLDKAVFALEYQQKGVWKKEYISADYKNGKLTAQVRDFGFFSIETDVSKPSIKPLNIKENTTFTGANGIIRFTISDSQSGIGGFSAYIDGKWTLMNYDQKTKSLSLDLNREGVTNGKHELELKVWDEKKNTATYTVNFNKN
ncbi:MAG: M23 family peptidase, partial [Weeksellaceae bacterium]|nr:M23 family peptidase [Weeksellaceae bacterium]